MHIYLVERLFGRCLFYDYYQIQSSKSEGDYVRQKKTKYHELLVVSTLGM
jgi:hypothetical protein